MIENTKGYGPEKSAYREQKGYFSQFNDSVRRSWRNNKLDTLLAAGMIGGVALSGGALVNYVGARIVDELSEKPGVVALHEQTERTINHTSWMIEQTHDLHFDLERMIKPYTGRPADERLTTIQQEVNDLHDAYLTSTQPTAQAYLRSLAGKRGELNDHLTELEQTQAWIDYANRPVAHWAEESFSLTFYSLAAAGLLALARGLIPERSPRRNKRRSAREDGQRS